MEFCMLHLAEYSACSYYVGIYLLSKKIGHMKLSFHSTGIVS